MLSNEEKNWAMLCHLSALLGFVLVPSANVWAPLIIWLLKKNDSPFVDEQGKESLNFHISWWIYIFIAGAMAATIILIPLAAILAGLIYLLGLIYTVVAAIAASNGQHYRYPFTIRFFQ
jgi:uncharacterized Tic20 family protein